MIGSHSIFCSDLDGTLLTTKSDVSQFTIKEINRIKDQVRVILASARMPKAMFYIQKDLGITNEPMICYNGAYVLVGERELLSAYIPMHVVEDIYNLCLGTPTALGLYHKDEWCVPNISERVGKEIKYTKAYPICQPTLTTINNWKKRNIGAHKIMLMGTKQSSDTIFNMLRQEYTSELHSYRSNDTLIELAPAAVSKLSGLKAIIGNAHSLSEVVAFGDNYNDIEMLQAVGCGVAVANARESVRKIADYVTLPNTEDGVAHFIREHVAI